MAIRAQALYYPESAPYNGPYAVDARLVDQITAAPYEGLWMPCSPFKQASLEVNGVAISAVTLNLFGTNTPDFPLNTLTVTVGGSETNGDTLTLTFQNPNLPGGQEAVAMTTSGGQSLASIATALAAGINSDVNLGALGFGASAVGAVVTVQYPSLAPQGQEGPSLTTPGLANTTILTTSLSGGATETLTVGLGTDGFQFFQATAAGLTFLPTPIKFIKARVAAFTGTNLSALFRGVG